MNINLRPYQTESHDSVIDALKTHKHVLAVLPTGAGKSINIGYLSTKLSGRTLILTHRIEIWTQNQKWLKDVGQLNAKVRKYKQLRDKKVVIAMAQTLAARIKKYGIGYIGEFDNIILDEVHVDIFRKVYSQYNYENLIGYTATPITMKTEKKTVDGVDYVRQLSMNRDYDVLVQTINEQQLVDLGFLTQDFNIALQLPNMEKLESSNSTPDGYTNQSVNEVYSNTVAFDILWQGYEKYCIGKKTIIFNSTTKVNKNLYEYLKDKGVNIKLFDSVNESEFTRNETIEWFKKEREAVLINVNVFTTGFDVTDVEVIIVNRATKSLSLWLQMTGRGSRITDLVYKDKFTVIDLGMNIVEHGRWSKERDWSEYFVTNDWRRKNIADLLEVWICKECGYYNNAGELMTDDGIVCDDCGEPRKGKPKKDKTGKLIELDRPLLPKARDIIAYTRKVGEGSNFAFKLAEQRILELFDNVTDEFYIRNRKRMILRVKRIWLPIYFAIIGSDLKGARRTIKNQGGKLRSKIDKKRGYASLKFMAFLVLSFSFLTIQYVCI